jgi:hypothetical protein
MKRKYLLELNVKLASVNPLSNNMYSIPYLPHPKFKSHNINFIKSESSRSFQQHQQHITIPSTWIWLVGESITK